MRAREVIQRIRNLGGRKLRPGKGSHIIFSCACGAWQTSVPMHKGEDVKFGLLKGIEGDLEACAHFGKGWLTK